MNRPNELSDIEAREMLATGEGIVTTLTDVRMVRDRAVIAERERCAKIAETEGVRPETNTLADWYQHAQRIAAKIREGK